MTFCLGITVEDGLVGLADTRITAGNEMTTAQKLSTYETASGAVFFMTSGLRSLRDKVATYFEEALEAGPPPDKLYKAVNLFADLVLGAHQRKISAPPADKTDLGAKFAGKRRIWAE